MIKLDQLTLLLIGWALGFPSALLLDWVRRLFRRRELKKAIITELVDLRYMMALNAYLMRNERGPLTNEFLDWLRPIVQNYHGPASIDLPNLPSWIAQLRNVSEELRQVAFLKLEKPDRGLYPKKHALPFLTAHVAELSVLPLAFQASLLRVKSQLELFNQHVDFLQKRHDMTFTVPNDKYERVVNDLRQGVIQLAQMAEGIANTISRVGIVTLGSVSPLEHRSG